MQCPLWTKCVLLEEAMSSRARADVFCFRIPPHDSYRKNRMKWPYYCGGIASGGTAALAFSDISKDLSA